MNRLWIIGGLLLCTAQVYGQNPKWYKKTAKAQLKVVTFDEKGDTLRQGFAIYTDTKGTALTSHALLKGAVRAVVIDETQKQWPVTRILGANVLYDAAKIQVDSKKVKDVFTLSSEQAKAGQAVWVLPQPGKRNPNCQADTIVQVDTFNTDFAYYTLKHAYTETDVNRPVTDGEGNLIGLIQSTVTGKEKYGYAISHKYGLSLQTNALSAANEAYSSIGIPTALPQDEDQALTYLYMTGTRDTAQYLLHLADFIAAFPKNTGGYTLRAEVYATQKRYELAEADYAQALKTADNKDEVHYAMSKLLYALNLTPQYEVYKDWNMERALQEAETALTVAQQPLYTQQAANCLFALKQYRNAYERYMALSQTNLRSPQVFLYAAHSLRMNNAPLDSIIALQDSAISCYAQPYPQEAAPVLMARANSLLEAGRHRDAVKDLYAYETLMSKHVNAYFYYTREQAEIKCRMFQQALDDINQAIRMAPQEVIFHAEKSAIHYRVGQMDEAIKAAQECIRIQPEVADGYRLLGIYYKEKGDEDMAGKMLTKAADLGDQQAAELLKK